MHDSRTIGFPVLKRIDENRDEKTNKPHVRVVPGHPGRVGMVELFLQNSGIKRHCTPIFFLQNK